MVKFTYLPDDRIARITDTFSSYNEPRNPIPEEITDLTGITDEMVPGRRIDLEAVVTFAAGAGIVIAHNANFLLQIVSAIGLYSSRRHGLAGNGGGMAQAWI